jgi:hypothetical protein
MMTDRLMWKLGPCQKSAERWHEGSVGMSSNLDERWEAEAGYPRLLLTMTTLIVLDPPVYPKYVPRQIPY